jgi:cation:H+ antiporter
VEAAVEIAFKPAFNHSPPFQSLLSTNSYMWAPILLLVFGFILLVWSADRFVSGAAATAQRLGVSKMLIGLTVVSVGTSTPEILVSLTAALEGMPKIAVGNAIGSNIANVGLVLGIAAMITPLPFARSVLKTELPWLIATTLLGLVLIFNLILSYWESLVLLSGLAYIMYRLARIQQNAPDEVSGAMREELDELPEMPAPLAIFWLLAGLVLLVISARLLVSAAVDIAELLGVSELVIGLTVIAIGTSLPELAATVGAAIKGHSELAIGNVVGSNILNILAVLAVPGLVATTALDSVVLWRDYGMMMALTMLLVLFAYGIGSRPVITRFEGAIIFLSWIGYTVLLFYQSQ